MKQLHASLVPNKLEAAIKAELESLQAEVVRLQNVEVTLKNKSDEALEQIVTMKAQKPCATISRCSIIGAADCSCGVDGPCETLTDVYLSAGANIPIKKVELDPAGNPKLELTVLERKAIDLLNSIKAATDGGIIELPITMQINIDAVLMMATVRRIGVQ